MSFHPNAVPAAKAAVCAGQQDPKLFWRLHDWLFVNQDAWASAQDAAAQFRTQALAVGADGAKYDACVADAATEARIQKDIDYGISLGVQGTPNLYANDWNLWSQEYAQIQQAIEKALQGAHPPPTPTPLPAGVDFFDADPSRPGFTYDGSPMLGSADAPVVVLIFEDFKSTDSAQHVASAEPTLKTKYIDAQRLRIVFKYFPVSAPRAAVAALCASQQAKFWEFRTLLYQKQAEWTEGDDAAMLGYAKSLRLDETRFGACLKDEKAQTEIDNAFSFAQSEIGVPSAPSYLFLKLDAAGQPENGKGYPGALPLDQFEKAIEEIQKPQAAAPTPPPAITEEQLAAVPVGIDAEGNFYRGDPKAAVKLIDYSDFQ